MRFTWEALSHPDNGLAEATGFDLIDWVETPDDYTVVVHYRQPYANMLGQFGGRGLGIFPRHACGEPGLMAFWACNTEPIGTGTFVLDSWDEGTGALDDGAGIGSMMAAAAFIGQMEQRPRRSIRVILFSGEEIGFYGADAYIEKHRDNIDAHLLGAEVDTGGGRANTLSSRVGENALGVVREMHKLVAPLGIKFNEANDVHAQSDMSELSKEGMPALHLLQDSNGYFMYHHTPNDTFDKIIPEDMRYLTAAYATLFYVAAELDVDFRQ